ncbi:tRNA (guanine-N(1)-)-methyltransferase [Campylobacterota bacterium]|nr:tRNA (guanine-N(1)-)-methyltransferase [Campylobacterota bacterium]
MTRLSFVTIFGELIAPYFQEAILRKAIARNLFSVETINPREYTIDKHQKTDDTPTGGGAGMVMTAQPLFDALLALKRCSPLVRIVFVTPCAKRFNHHDAKRLAAYDHIAFVCGRYEGFDERAIETLADEVLSIGDFVLTGGELPALVIADALVRHIDGVLGSCESLDEESFENARLEAPAFTKPTTFRGLTTPAPLLSGHHKAIAAFRAQLGDRKTRYFRPDLLKLPPI